MIGRVSEPKRATRAFDNSWRGRVEQNHPTLPRPHRQGLGWKLFQVEQLRAVFVNQFQHASATTRYAGERVFGHHYRQSGFFHQQLVYIPQQRATAGQDNAALGHIRAQFRRCLFQRHFDSADNA